MPGVRAVMEAFRRRVGENGLLQAMNGWNYVDWVGKAWNDGVPPDGHEGTSGVINWQYALVLGLTADLEDLMGESELAHRNRRLLRQVAAAQQQRFWDDTRGLYADDQAHSKFSEHAQCLAILSGQVPVDLLPRLVLGLAEATDLARATIYFSHYLLEAFYRIGRGDLMLRQIGRRWAF